MNMQTLTVIGRNIFELKTIAVNTQFISMYSRPARYNIASRSLCFRNIQSGKFNKKVIK